MKRLLVLLAAALVGASPVFAQFWSFSRTVVPVDRYYDQEGDGYFRYGLFDISKDALVTGIRYASLTPLYGKYALAQTEGRYLYLDAEGMQVFGKTFAFASVFSEGLAWVSEGDGKLTAINESGKEVFTLEAEYAYAFHDGWSVFCSGGLFGLVDKKGKVTVKPTYAFAIPIVVGELWEVGSAPDTRCLVTVGKKGVRPLTEMKYAAFGNPYVDHLEHYVQLLSGQLIPFVESENWQAGFMDRSGRVVIEPKYYSNIVPDLGGFIVENGEEKAGWIDAAGNEMFPQHYQAVNSPFGEAEYAIVTTDWQEPRLLIKRDGTTVPTEYSYISYFNPEGYASVYSDGIAGVIDGAGNLTQLPVTSVSTIKGDNRFILHTENSGSYLADREGNRITKTKNIDFEYEWYTGEVAPYYFKNVGRTFSKKVYAAMARIEGMLNEEGGIDMGYGPSWFDPTCVPYSVMNGESVVARGIYSIDDEKPLFEMRGAKDVTPMHEGVGVVTRLDGRRIMIKGDGKFVPAQRPGKGVGSNDSYRYLGSFSEGRAWMSSGDGVFHAIDESGANQTQLTACDWVFPFNDQVSVFLSAQGGVGLVTMDSQILWYTTEYVDAKPFRVYGFLPVKKPNGKWGVVDTERNIVVQFQYDDIAPNTTGSWTQYLFDMAMMRVPVVKDGKYGVIRLSGADRTVIEPKYREIVSDFVWYRFRDDNGYGWTDENGDVMIPAMYENAGTFGLSNYANVQIPGEGWAYIRRDGTYATSARYADALPFTDYGYAAVKEADGKYYLIDKDFKKHGEGYDSVFPLASSERFAVTKGNASAIVEGDGTVVVPFVEGRHYDKVMNGHADNTWLWKRAAACSSQGVEEDSRY